jgi:hypothetical protein
MSRRRRFTSQQRSIELPRSSLCLNSAPTYDKYAVSLGFKYAAHSDACFYFRTRVLHRIGATSPSPTPSRVAVAWPNHGHMRRCTVFASVATKPATKL